ncbi:hypothetical protein [Enterobacter hormaechei]|uniref:hypothetical protein n=1 Tax=Enterobacter hormaechei TaxID=158836 RepID=UPI003D3688B7
MKHKKAIAALLASFKADGINPADFDACLNSISQMVMPRYLTAVYVDFIYSGSADHE